jgi:hypothetical protein
LFHKSRQVQTYKNNIKLPEAPCLSSNQWSTVSPRPSRFLELEPEKKIKIILKQNVFVGQLSVIHTVVEKNWFSV